MLRCLTRALYYQFKDLKTKTILEKLAKAKVEAGADPADVDMEELAQESGLAPSNRSNLEHFVQEKEAVLGMLQEQRLRRIARREAFLEWQAGQREKGAAHRLLRQARKAEKYKRRHYHATSGRMVPVQPMQRENPDSYALASLQHRALRTENPSGKDAKDWERIRLTLDRK